MKILPKLVEGNKNEKKTSIFFNNGYDFILFF